MAALLLDFNGLVDFSNVVIGAQFLSTCAVVLVRRAPMREADAYCRAP